MFSSVMERVTVANLYSRFATHKTAKKKYYSWKSHSHSCCVVKEVNFQIDPWSAVNKSETPWKNSSMKTKAARDGDIETNDQNQMVQWLGSKNELSFRSNRKHWKSCWDTEWLLTVWIVTSNDWICMGTGDRGYPGQQGPKGEKGEWLAFATYSSWIVKSSWLLLWLSFDFSEPHTPIIMRYILENIQLQYLSVDIVLVASDFVLTLKSSSISILIFWKMKTFNFVKCTQHSCSIKGPWWSMCSFINCWFYWFEVKTFLHPTANLIWHKVLLFQATPLWFQGEQRGMLWSESHDYGDESAPLFSCTFVCFATANVCSIFFFFMTVSALLLRIVPNMTFKPIAQAF